MASFVRRFSLSSSPPHDTQPPTPRRKTSISNGRILGARDYKLANTAAVRPSPHQNASAGRRSSEVTLTNDMDAEADARPRRPGRILGARDYQQAIEAERLKRRRSSVASTLTEEKMPVLASDAVSGIADGAERESDGRIYGARDYKLVSVMMTRKMSAGA